MRAGVRSTPVAYAGRHRILTTMMSADLLLDLLRDLLVGERSLDSASSPLGSTSDWPRRCSCISVPLFASPYTHFSLIYSSELLLLIGVLELVEASFYLGFRLMFCAGSLPCLLQCPYVESLLTLGCSFIRSFSLVAANPCSCWRPSLYALFLLCARVLPSRWASSAPVSRRLVPAPLPRKPWPVHPPFPPCRCRLRSLSGLWTIPCCEP